MPNITEKLRKVRENCPAGYSVALGNTIDMLGAKELWRIFENHPEPHVDRIPEDVVDTPFGYATMRIPKEWGPCLYYKVV